MTLSTGLRVRKIIVCLLAIVCGASYSHAQEYLYGLTQTGGYYNQGVAYQITTSGQDYIAYGSFDGNNGGNPGNAAGFVQFIFQNKTAPWIIALTTAGNQNLNQGAQVYIAPGQGGFVGLTGFLLTEDETGFNPTGKSLVAPDGLVYAMTSNEGLFDGGSLFRRNAFPGTLPYPVVFFDGADKGRSPKGSLIQGPDGLMFGMTEYGGINDMGVIFSYDLSSQEYLKIFDFSGTTTGANPTGSLLLASDGKLYGMTRTGGTANNGVIFRINTDGSGFTKLRDLTTTSGTAPLGSLIQHSNGVLYGMTSAGGTNGFGTIFSLTLANTFTKLVDFNGTNGKSPVGDFVSSSDGQTMYGVARSGGNNDMGVLFKLEQGNQFTVLYHFSSSTGSNPVGSLMMKRKYPEITFPDMPVKTAIDAPFTPATQSSSGLPVYFFSSDPNVAVVENNQIKPVAPGNVTITAYQVGNHEYHPAWTSKLLSIEKADQIINFPPIAAKTFGDAPFTLSATSSSGLPVNITSSSSDVLSSDGTQFFVNNAGTVTIRAIQEGNEIYNPAEVNHELVVNRANQTITFDSPGDRSCCADFSLTATSSSGLEVGFKTNDWEKLYITENTARIHELGTVEITAFQNGDRNYNPAEISHTINLLKGNQSILFSIPTNVTYRFGDNVFIGSGSTSGLPVTYTSNPPGIAVVEGSYLYLIGVGTTTITATQDGSDLMHAASPVLQTVTVEPALVPGTGNVITFENLNTRFVNTPPFNLTGEATSGLPVAYQSSNPSVAVVTGNLVSIKGVGTTTITATQPGNQTTSAALPVQRTFEVIKQSQYVYLESWYYGKFGDLPVPFPSRSSAGLPIVYSSSNPEIAYVDENYMLNITGSGDASITASQPGNEEYDAANSVSTTIYVTPLYQTISFEELSPQTFGDAPFTIAATASSGYPVSFSSSNPEIATVNGSTVTITAAGTAVITASQNGYPGFINVEMTRELVVNKANQQITFAPLPQKNFNDYSFSPSATSSAGLPIAFSSSAPAVAKVEGNKIFVLGSGTVEIIATQEGNEDYLPAEARQNLTIVAPEKTFEMVGMTFSGGQNNSGAVFTMNTDGTGFSSLKSFSPQNSAAPEAGFIKGTDGKMYGNFRTGGTRNHGRIVRFEADGSGMTVIHNFEQQSGGLPHGNLLQASDGDLYGTTRTGGPLNEGTIFKVKADGSGYTVLHEFESEGGIISPGGLIEVAGKLYGMTQGGSFFSHGTIFSINKDGSDYEVIFQFNEHDPVKSGYYPRGELVDGTDGYLYGTLAYGGDNSHGTIFKVQPDGSNFSKVVVFDGVLKGSSPGASILVGSDGKLYGVTQAGGAHGQGTIFAVNTDGSNFTRLFDFDGPNTGGSSMSSLTEGTDGFLYGMANTGGANDLGTVFKIGKNGTGFQVLSHLTTAASRPMYGPLLETTPGSFFGMTSSGGPGNGGAVFNITSGGTFAVVKDFPQEFGTNPTQLIPDNAGEFYYGLTQVGNPSIFRISKSGQYSDIYETPDDVVIIKLYYISTGHLWCIGTKNGLPHAFRIKQDGTEFEPLPQITSNIPPSTLVDWLTERSDGTIFGVTTNASNPGMIFSIEKDGTGFSSLGYMPAGVEFAGSGFLRSSDENIYALSAYSHTLYRYDGETANPMKPIAVLPDEIGQLPVKLFEINGGRIGAAMYNGQISSMEKDGSQFKTILSETTTEQGTGIRDIVQSFDGWIYVAAPFGGPHNKGAVYKIRSDGSSYTALRLFDGYDGESPNSIIFTRLTQTLTFDPLEPMMASDPAVAPVATSSSGARVEFTSSNTSVAIIEDGKIKPVGKGTAIITASIPPNANYYSVNSIQRELVVEKLTQSISFDNPGEKVLGDASFELIASSDAGLDVTFLVLSGNITIDGSVVTMTDAGVARIRAIQEGNEIYDVADPVEVSFCVNPSKPAITASGSIPNLVLTSSNNIGNQWYLNNAVINGATQNIYQPGASGTYTVVTTVEGCSSLQSDPYALVITSVDGNPELRVDVFPNPTKDVIYVEFKGHTTQNASVELWDTYGRIVDVQEVKSNRAILDASKFGNGLYIIKVIMEQGTLTRKVIKR